MQEFLNSEKVDFNLMSLTGYRALVLLKLLMHSPLSLQEINDYYLKNKFIDSTFSIYTIRIYIKSLRLIGCDISRATKSTGNKYILHKSPFDYKVTAKTVNILERLYKKFYTEFSPEDFLLLDEFLQKLSEFASDDALKERLLKISKIRSLDKSIFKSLISACARKSTLHILYKSPKVSDWQAQIKADKIEYKNNKIYLCGYIENFKAYSYLPISRIKKIIAVNINTQEKEIEILKAEYEIQTNGKEFFPKENQTILEHTSEKVKISEDVTNKFEFLQTLVSKGESCTLLSTGELRERLISKLKRTRALYD